MGTFIGVAGESAPCIPITPVMQFGNQNIYFSIPKHEKGSLKIFDMKGRLIATIAETAIAAGTHQLKWDVANVKAGIYVLKMKAGNYMETRKLAVAK